MIDRLTNLTLNCEIACKLIDIWKMYENDEWTEVETINTLKKLKEVVKQIRKELENEQINEEQM